MKEIRPDFKKRLVSIIFSLILVFTFTAGSVLPLHASGSSFHAQNPVSGSHLGVSVIESSDSSQEADEKKNSSGSSHRLDKKEHNSGSFDNTIDNPINEEPVSEKLHQGILAEKTQTVPSYSTESALSAETEVVTLPGSSAAFSVPQVTEPAEIATYKTGDYEDRKIILSFKTTISQKRMKQILQKLPHCTLLSFHEDMALIQAASSSALKKALTVLPSIEEIALIQPDYSYTASETLIDEEPTAEDSAYPLPNDTYFRNQWGLFNDGGSFISTASQRNAREGIDINILKAWSHFQSSEEIIIAVIDTGIDYKHPDLKGRICINTAELNGIKGEDDDGNGYADDIYGWDFYNNDASVCHYNSKKQADPNEDDNHGTHCAGIIAAVPNNSAGITGTAANLNIKILPVKALGGPEGTSDSYTLARAIRYAASRGARICNASWTTYDNDSILKTAILESNMFFVCVAGNNMITGGDNLDKKSCYPASFRLPNTITVGSIDADGHFSQYSNYGTKTVALAAPGTRIVSTIVGNYAYMSGTSMAAPFVTGAAAMIYAKNNDLYPSDIVKILTGSARELPGLKGKVSSRGILDVYAALIDTDHYQQTLDFSSPSISVSVAPYQKHASIQISVTDKGGSYLLLSRYAKGKKKASWFENGENGHSFGKKLTLKSEGYYTFFAMDAAGNTRTKTIKITFDKKPPSASLQVKKKKKTYQVTIKAKDALSGLKQVRYLAGRQKASAFKNGKKGTLVPCKSGKAVITLRRKGSYSFYFQDQAGNSIVKVLKIKK